MKYNLYTVSDSIAEDNGPIFQAVNSGVAIRQYRSILESTKYPQDFKLFHVGTWDSEKMELIALIPQEVRYAEVEDGSVQ